MNGHHGPEDPNILNDTMKLSVAQPDVTLMLDTEGVIREVTFSEAVCGEGPDLWVGRPWIETVAEVGSGQTRQLVEEARTSGVSAVLRITQRFPSGRELAMEYTTVRLAGKAGLVAVGRSLQAVAELQSSLIAAQRAGERGSWKLREIETRYRLLFETSTKAVVLIEADSLRIIDANPAASRALRLAPGRGFLASMTAGERDPFQAMLARVRAQAKVPGMLAHFGRGRSPWMVRASLITSDPGPAFLLQLMPASAAKPARRLRTPAISLEELIDRFPDGFVVLDHDGTILRANQAFLDFAQIDAKQAILGEPLARWLSRPGADLAVLLGNLFRHGVVRRFATTIHGEQGAESEIEISAVGNANVNPRHIGVLMRHVGLRPAMPENDNFLRAGIGSAASRTGKTELRKLVADAVGTVERQCIEAALELADGNRTAAAELLGLSRQSLYERLNRYSLDERKEATPQRRE
jgi:transcriptional regulator PpsR